jgi:transcriptional regulator with XRE-family HTH domain
MSTKKSATLAFLEKKGGALTLGNFLIAIREGEDVSQVEFARTLGISRSHLCDIEHGRKSLSVDRAARFAKILGYSQTQFVRLALQALVHEAGLKLDVEVRAA